MPPSSKPSDEDLVRRDGASGMKGICAVTVKGASDLKCFENSVLQWNIQAHFIHFVSSIYVLP